MTDLADIEKLAEELVAALKEHGISRLVAIYHVVDEAVSEIDPKFWVQIEGSADFKAFEGDVSALIAKIEELLAAKYAGFTGAAGAQLNVDTAVDRVWADHAYENPTYEPGELKVEHW